MAVYFHCAVCGGMHPSRFRARNQRTLEDPDFSVGAFLEPCPVRGVWAEVDKPDLTWRDLSAPGSGSDRQDLR